MDQNTQDLFENFMAVIDETVQLVYDITQVETAKTEAASLRQHHLINGYVQQEQAQILKLRGLEQRRTRLVRDLGWDGLTFRQILDQASLHQRNQMQPLFEELEWQVRQLQDSMDAAGSIIRVRLHELDVTLAQQTGSSYDSSGNAGASVPLHSAMRDTYV